MKEETVYQRGRDLVIALDVSRSMLANDVHPNRLQRAKADIMDLVKELRGDRAALLAFRRKAILLCPLTTDYAYLKQSLEAVNIDSAPPGETDIGDALAKTLDAFENEGGLHKAIILISDGEDLTGRALSAAEKVKERNIPIFTVGLGDRKGAKIPEPDNKHKYIKYKGKDVITKLDHGTLYEIAKITGGAYIPVETASMTSITLGTLYRDYLRKISAQDLEETLQHRYIERYQLFLLPSILLMLAGSFLSLGRLCVSAPQSETSTQRAEGGNLKPESKAEPLKDLSPPKQEIKHLAILVSTFLISTVTSAITNPVYTNTPNSTTQVSSLIPHPSPIPPGREGARIAQKLYSQGKYAQSAEAYLEAVKGSTRKSQHDFQYNAAVALFKAGKYKKSADILRELTQLEKLGENEALMGLGSALYRLAQISKDPEPEQAAKKAKLLREAGEAFKDAARSKPDSESARNNLGIVLQALPEVEEQAMIAELMAKYEKTPAFEIADKMLSNQRNLIKEIPVASTDDSPTKIKQFEQLAKAQKNNVDLWIPLKDKLLNTITQQEESSKLQQQIVAVNQLIESTRDSMQGAALSLRDLDTEGYESAMVSEAGVYQLWKGIAPYPHILKEDLQRQTNAISLTMMNENPQSIQAQQQEALDLTRLFTKRFSEAGQAGVRSQPPSPDPGEPWKSEDRKGISEEDRQKILELADQAISAQEEALKLLKGNKIAESLADQQKSHSLLKEIERLLPKDQNKQDQKKEQEKQEKQEEDQKKTDQQKEDQKQEESLKQQPQPEPQTQEEEKRPEQEQEKKEVTPEEVRKLLEKAIQREKEHEAEKYLRNRYVPPSPLDRDW